MDIAITFALLATLAGNGWMLARHWPAVARALAGPQPPGLAPQRPPAEVIRLSEYRRAAVAPGPAEPLRLAA